MVSITLPAGDGNVDISYGRGLLHSQIYRRSSSRNERGKLLFTAGDLEYGERSPSLTKKGGQQHS